MVVAAPLDVDQVGAPGMTQGTPVIHRAAAPAARPALAPSLLVGLTSLVVYLLTLAPSITWQHHGADSAELAVAAAVLGVPHPPGYPTWTLLAWLFTHLPLAELAQRVALLSAFSAAATVAIVVWLVQALWPHQPGQRAAAVLAGLTLAFQMTFWSQAILVEVYALHTLFVALICALTLPQAPGHPGRRRVAAFLFGLGLGNHLSLIFFAPLLLWDGSPRFDGGAIVSAAQSRGFRDLTLLPLPLLAGLAVYLYLPLAAGRHPVLLWGDATTPGGFWWLVSGQLYRGALFGLTVPEMLMRAQSWLSLLAQPLTWPGLILAALGLWRLATQARRLALLTVGVALMVAIVALGYATADAFVYLLPLQVLAALWQAAGVLTLVAWLTRGRAGGWIWLLCLLPVALLWHNWANVDLSRDTEARQYALAALAAAAPDALLIADGDEHAFALWYAQDGLGERPDVAIVERTLWNFDWYRRHLVQRWPDLSAAAGPDVNDLIESQRGRRPIFITDPDEDMALRFELRPVGTLFEVAWPGSP
ncbi:DUF2723 domain-containing protein [Candidatus Amarolinea dominans]|uniref:protein O-mannosyl-transferase family n=1 Tax=Candidatus Amarolinea dominans TaxID=3140696 RepID=UPI001D6FD4AA|nr:DUF2723 domain-containing protein [Anaerolineae bacterium]